MSTKVSQPGQGVSAGPAAFSKSSSQTSRPGGFRLSTQFGKSASQVSLSPEMSRGRNFSTPATARGRARQGRSASTANVSSSMTPTPGQRRRRFNDTREIDVLISEISAHSRAAQRSNPASPYGAGAMSPMLFSPSTDSLAYGAGIGSGPQSPYIPGSPTNMSQSSLLRGRPRMGRPGALSSLSQLDVTGISQSESGLCRVAIPEGMGVGVTDSPYPAFLRNDSDPMSEGNGLRGPAMTSSSDMLQDPDMLSIGRPQPFKSVNSGVSSGSPRQPEFSQDGGHAWGGINSAPRIPRDPASVGDATGSPATSTVPNMTIRPTVAPATPTEPTKPDAPTGQRPTQTQPKPSAPSSSTSATPVTTTPTKQATASSSNAKSSTLDRTPTLTPRRLFSRRHASQPTPKESIDKIPRSEQNDQKRRGLFGSFFKKFKTPSKSKPTSQAASTGPATGPVKKPQALSPSNAVKNSTEPAGKRDAHTPSSVNNSTAAPMVPAPAGPAKPTSPVPADNVGGNHATGSVTDTVQSKSPPASPPPSSTPPVQEFITTTPATATLPSTEAQKSSPSSSAMTVGPQVSQVDAKHVPEPAAENSTELRSRSRLNEVPAPSVGAHADADGFLNTTRPMSPFNVPPSVLSSLNLSAEHSAPQGESSRTPTPKLHKPGTPEPSAQPPVPLSSSAAYVPGSSTPVAARPVSQSYETWIPSSQSVASSLYQPYTESALPYMQSTNDTAPPVATHLSTSRAEGTSPVAVPPITLGSTSDDDASDARPLLGYAGTSVSHAYGSNKDAHAPISSTFSPTPAPAPLTAEHPSSPVSPELKPQAAMHEAYHLRPTSPESNSLNPTASRYSVLQPAASSRPMSPLLYESNAPGQGTSAHGSDFSHAAPSFTSPSISTLDAQRPVVTSQAQRAQSPEMAPVSHTSGLPSYLFASTEQSVMPSATSASYLTSEPAPPTTQIYAAPSSQSYASSYSPFRGSNESPVYTTTVPSTSVSASKNSPFEPLDKPSSHALSSYMPTSSSHVWRSSDEVLRSVIHYDSVDDDKEDSSGAASRPVSPGHHLWRTSFGSNGNATFDYDPRTSPIVSPRREPVESKTPKSLSGNDSFSAAAMYSWQTTPPTTVHHLTSDTPSSLYRAPAPALPSETPTKPMVTPNHHLQKQQSRVMSQQPLRPQESKEGLRTSESSEIEGSRGLQLSPSMQDLVKLSLMDSSTLNADVDVLG